MKGTRKTLRLRPLCADDAGPRVPSSETRHLNLGSEFLREWEAQDMRVTLFKLLLLWLVLSLLCIQLAWGFYGSTVTGLYHRPGLGGQNGSTPDGSTHFPSWETAANEPLKTHRE
ncbi:PREDICTED: T-cell leukemia translocation-altered gene protein [Myotis davidii]|uniref:T-cell leukemia translocation-altered gene protein n=1 Tax=Myotis davidii TaxID=225400 RepID=UPI0007671DEF|nr:PREDICTED: T-cell leukemia translocation-altered gene protein [Myotis davidii]